MSGNDKVYFTNEEILNFISEFEKNNNIKVLFAVESGSRMWGFESNDSDYDIRVVFQYPIDKYLSINPVKNTIDYMYRDPRTEKPVLDIVGWELKFFTKNIIKSNPSVYEWFMSSIIYFEKSDIHKFRKTFMNNVDKISLAYHYRGIIFKNYNKYVKDHSEVKCKKYIYIMRAIACYYALVKYNDLPEMLYTNVLKYLPTTTLGDKMKELVAQKQESESTLTKSDSEINEECIKIMNTVSNRNIKLTSFSNDTVNLINSYVIEQLHKY